MQTPTSCVRSPGYRGTRCYVGLGRDCHTETEIHKQRLIETGRQTEADRGSPRQTAIEGDVHRVRRRKTKTEADRDRRGQDEAKERHTETDTNRERLIESEIKRHRQRQIVTAIISYRQSGTETDGHRIRRTETN